MEQLRETPMQEHEWIVEVCVDLERYAQTHELTNLASVMKDAVATAKLDALLLAAKGAFSDDDGSNSSYENGDNIIPLRGTW